MTDAASGSASDPAGSAQLIYGFAPLTGRVEHELAQLGEGPAQPRARWLLEQVLSGLVRSGRAVPVSDLTLSEFDAILAAFYRRHYGDTVPSQTRCSDCAEPFELTFRLSEMQAKLAQGAAAFGGDPAGVLTAPSGRTFRLPRVSDLDTLDPAGSEDWLRGLMQEGTFDAEALQQEIAEAGPVLSQDLTAPCPDCGTVNTIRFDLADFLLRTLTGEGAFLWREVHLLARSYGWGLTEILSLACDKRRELARMVVAEAPRARLAS